MFIFTKKMSLAVKHIHAFALVTIDSFDIDRGTTIRLDEKDWKQSRSFCKVSKKRPEI